MRIADWTNRVPTALVERLAETGPWREACAGGKAWADAAASPGAVRAAAGALPAEDADLLRLVLRKYGPRPFEPEQLAEAAEAAGWPSVRAMMALKRLRAAGIVFTLRKSWGDAICCLPSDGYAHWLNALLPAKLAPLEADGRAVRPKQPFVEPFSLQLLQMMAELGKAGAAITSRGTLPKRTAAAAAARLKIGDEALEALAVRCPRSDDSGLPLAVALDAAMLLGLLAFEEGRLVWRGELLGAWLAAAVPARERRLLDVMTERLAAYDERYMHAAALLRAMRGGIWYAAPPIDEWLSRHAPAAARDWRGWVRALAGFGWMQTGRTADGAEAVRWTIDPGAEDGDDRAAAAARPAAIRVAPAGGLAVPPDLDYRQRWELELMAEPESPGPLAGYALTAKSVGRYLELGRTAEDALAALESAAGEPLPDALAGLVTGFARKAGRAAFAEALLLRFADDASAELAAANPLVAPLLGERLGGRCFVVERDAAPELRKRLERAGVPARSGVEGGDGGPAAPVPRMDGFARGAESPLPPNAGLLDPPFHWHLYAVDAGCPDDASADCGGMRGAAGRPAAARLPSAWLRSVREYHPSTRREIVKRAIELGAAVRLVRDGRTIEVLPSRIDESADGWRLTGRLAGKAAETESGEPDAVTLTPDMWSAMQLLLPDGSSFRK